LPMQGCRAASLSLEIQVDGGARCSCCGIGVEKRHIPDHARLEKQHLIRVADSDEKIRASLSEGVKVVRLVEMLTAVENGGAGTVSRRSKMAAHNRAVLWEVRIGATAPITPPFRERHRSAQRHGDMERDTT